jgi:hypothetical protein
VVTSAMNFESDRWEWLSARAGFPLSTTEEGDGIRFYLV